jgi:hypothetical protein
MKGENRYRSLLFLKWLSVVDVYPQMDWGFEGLGVLGV